MINKLPGKILKWFIINRIIFLTLFFIFLAWLWFDTNRKVGFLIFATSARSLLAIFFILCPWEAIISFILLSLRNTLKPRVISLWEKSKDSFQTFYGSDFPKRVVRSTFVLFIYVFFARLFYYMFVKEISPFGFHVPYLVLYLVIPIVGVFVIRMIYRWMLSPLISPLEKSKIEVANQYFSRQTNGLGILAYTLTAGVSLVLIMFFLSSESNLIEYSYSSNPKIQSWLTIQDIQTNSPQITGHLHIVEQYGNYKSGYYDEGFYVEPVGIPPVLFDWSTLLINGVEIPIVLENQTAIVDTDIVLSLDGNQSSFPFSKFAGDLHIYPINPKTFGHPLGIDYEVLRENMILQIEIQNSNSPFRIYQAKNKQADSLDGGDNSRYSFVIEYAPYYKLLVTIIICVLFVFLWVIWRVNDRGQLVELSVGIFATIITLRGFLIPQTLTNAPIVLDQVLLIYITFFLLILLFKSSFEKI